MSALLETIKSLTSVSHLGDSSLDFPITTAASTSRDGDDGGEGVSRGGVGGGGNGGETTNGLLATFSHSTNNHGMDKSNAPASGLAHGPGVHIESSSHSGGPPGGKQSTHTTGSTLTSPGAGAGNNYHDDNNNHKDKNKDNNKDKNNNKGSSNSKGNSNTGAFDSNGSADGGDNLTAQSQGGHPSGSRRSSTDNKHVSEAAGAEVLYKDISTLLVAVASKGHTTTVIILVSGL